MYPSIGYFYDPTTLILVPAILFTMYAQFKVSTETNKYFRINTHRGYTGEQAARRILDLNGLDNVRIEVSRGRLSDHYDPRGHVVRLSEDVYYGTSITSVSVAAHECGHAIQHATGYSFLNFRTALVPVVNFSSNMSWLLIMLGLFVSNTFLEIGILLFAASVLFQVVTLPVEFNASSRAILQLEKMEIIDGGEVKQSRNVLTAAALTYVAAALTAALQLLRLLVIANNRDND